MKTKLLCALGGILYSSWLLGPWLNPLAAGHKLASQLGGVHQPYSWVFIGGDVACGIVSIILAYILWSSRAPVSGRRLFAIVVGGVAIFGVSTALAAGVPVRCETAIQSCPGPLHDPQLLIHGVASVLSSVVLGVSLLALWAMSFSNGWAAGLFVAYTVSGAASLSEIIRPAESNSLQHIFLAMTSLCLVAIPWLLERTLVGGKKVEIR